MNFDVKTSKGKSFFRLLALLPVGILVGLVCGVVGSLFSLAVSFVTDLRMNNGWIFYLLPVGGIASVIIYKLFKVTEAGTDDAVHSAHTDKKVSWRLTPAVFICSVITHLCGGSAGREGAALKMGGGVAALAAKVLRLDERSRRTVALAGMSGVFAAVFGTPLGAAVFTLEVVRSKSVRWWAILTSLVSAFCAYGVSLLFGIKPERFHIPQLPKLSFEALWKVAVIALLGGIVAYLFCTVIHSTASLGKKAFKNEYLRVLVFALAIIGLTFIVKTTDYHGGGINIIEGIFEGENPRYEAFALKIVFTALTVAAGFKGGEIVPAFFVGATFGGAAAMLLGISPAFGAAIGMTALFCGVTNSPIATLIISCEMFGVSGILFYFITVVLSFLVSGKASLYDTAKYPFKEIFAKSEN